MRRNQPGTPLPTLPGITPGLEDHLRRHPPWNLWESADSPSGSMSPTLSGNTRPTGFYLPRAFSREPYLYYPVFNVCVCDSLKTVLRRVFLCFSENSLCPLAVCCLFREQLIFLVSFKGISLIPLVFFTSAVKGTVSAPSHGFASADELNSTGIVFRQRKTLVEVQVVG